MTDFLFARPNWLDGAMSILDLFAVSPEYNSSETPEEADKKAYNADVNALKSDFNVAYGKVIANVQ